MSVNHAIEKNSMFEFDTNIFEEICTSKTILIADDDDVDREKIRRSLMRINSEFKIIEASSGHDALEYVKQMQFDCIFIDNFLGDTTGVDLAAEIQKHINSAIPIIMITGLGSEQLAVKAMQNGIYDYLPKKNITMEKLDSTLSSCLKRAELERTLSEARNKLQRMSLYDELTGLPNRYLFFDRLNQSIHNSSRDKRRFVVMMMDMNFFKEVNDNLGHEIGDGVLAKIGDRLEVLMRKSDTIARLGGDEFACILAGTDSIEGAISCAEKIITAVNEPIAINNHICQLGISIGIAMYPQHGSESNTLLSNADHAMYSAKRSQRKYCVYSEHSSNGHIHPIPLSSKLPKAIDNHELFIEYQPKINLESNQLTGVEALVRWNSPEHGLIYPGQFIPSAERSSLIEKLTYSIISMVFERIFLWRQTEWQLPVSINLSARLLDNISFPGWVFSQLEKHKLKANDIIFEITETALASSSLHAQAVLAEFASSGIGISIDDFGTGFTSFKCIRDLEISEIKIDRLFVAELLSNKKDVSIVSSIITLANNLGIKVVAEGIELIEQRIKLKELGCTDGQGYHIAYPMTADKLWCWHHTQSAAS